MLAHFQSQGDSKKHSNILIIGAHKGKERTTYIVYNGNIEK